MDTPSSSPNNAAPQPGRGRKTWRWTPLRTLGTRHRARVSAHLLKLDDADRLRRFGHIASDELIRQYVDRIDFDRDEVFGAFNSRLELVAMAHLAFEPGAATAEFGVSVNAQARGRGLGAHLFDHAVTHARNRGARTMLIHMARDNAAMLSIVRNAGAKLQFQGPDALAELPLPADTLGSQIQELLGHQAAEFDYRLKLQVLRLDLWRAGTA